MFLKTYFSIVIPPLLELSLRFLFLSPLFLEKVETHDDFRQAKTVPNLIKKTVVNKPDLAYP